jgi:hypothetical protein
MTQQAPQTPPVNKKVFVAYAYNLYDKRDYRKTFANLESAFGVQFIFADEKITNMHILAKITSYIDAADFSLFDISSWNPNVTLELGIALAKSDQWYICFNPDKTDLKEVPSDIRGIDRIQYNSFSDLEDKLTVLLEQRYPRSVPRSVDDFLLDIQNRITDLLNRQPGLRSAEIATVLNMDKRFVQMAVSGLIGQSLRMEGRTKGARYYPSHRDAS